ncbi:hypothetical protein [Brevundimonas sp.]|uniref:hypothetical protein n=1 Tax=Brevundimonas sp. TaxID=1871086 RepID=UPI002D2F4636|nr:hypothetical protein [Brevundimonas sp.]HYC97003.1 hypothetical protein [Brevundimonas sp.]
MLVVLGGGLIAMAATTPWHTDANAYFEGLKGIRESLYDDTGGTGGMDSFDRASRDFHALQDRYETPKWLYADLGYAAMAWSLLLYVAAVGGWRATRRVTVVVPLSLALLVTGLFASAFQAVGREQVPEWADTLAIPLMGAVGVGIVLLPVVLALALAPILFTRRDPVVLWSVVGRRWGTSLVVSLMYLAPAGLAVLAVLVAWQTGGWAISTGGAVMLWLLLNARAIWLGRSTPVSTQPLP